MHVLVSVMLGILGRYCFQINLSPSTVKHRQDRKCDSFEVHDKVIFSETQLLELNAMQRKNWARMVKIVLPPFLNEHIIIPY